MFEKIVWRWSQGGVDIVITDTRELSKCLGEFVY